MTKAQLEKDKSRLEKDLKSTGLAPNVRTVLEGALEKVNKMIDEGDYTGGGAAPAKTARAAKKEKQAKKGKGVLAKKEKTPLENCKEILAKYNKDKTKGKQRIAKRVKAGKPEELTVNETLKKTAKVVEHKVEKTEEAGKKLNIEAAVSGIRAIMVSIFDSTEGAERGRFLKELTAMMREVGKKYGYNKDNKYALGGTTDDEDDDEGGRTFHYTINLNERGSFYATVDDSEGNEVYSIKAGNELEEGESSIFDDGYMRNIDDVKGLEEYLKQLEIIEPEDRVVRGAAKGMEVPDYDDEKPLGKNMRIYSYRTQNFDVCPEAELMFDKLLANPEADTVKLSIVNVATDIDNFLGVVKKYRQARETGKFLIVGATGYVMRAMYWLYPVLSKIVDPSDVAQNYPRFIGDYLSEIAGFDTFRKGGRIKSAINRDRAYESDQEHELRYKRKNSPKHPRYKKENGGTVKFDDKVKAISKNLKGKKVPAKYKKQYGQKYDATEAKAAARRIAGSMEGGNDKVPKKLMGGIINVESIDNLSAHSGDAWFYN